MSPSQPILYLIPTTLADDTSTQVLSPQIIDVVAHTQLFMVENLRTARRFISGLKLGVVIDDLEIHELHKDTPAQAWQPILAEKMLKDGQNVGVLSEAGCPGVADPGAKAVAWAHQHKVRVVPLVGPSSILLALMASGFNGQSFVFHGYLPIETQARAKQLKHIEREATQTGRTQIFMETPYRNKKLLSDICQQVSPKTLLCVAAGITSVQETILTQSVEKWKKSEILLDKIPAIFLIGTQ
jgi:16S rRNA (cytidine1402-2'-O)-methyltransferase